MTEERIVSVKSRPPTPEELDLATWFDEQETQSVDRLESAARQIISLVTAFLGVVLGALSLGSEKFEATLRHPLVLGIGGVAVGLLLLALIGALGVVIPWRYTYGEADAAGRRAVYRRLVAFKSGWLQAGVIFFGSGLVCSACFIGAMLVARV